VSIDFVVCESGSWSEFFLVLFVNLFGLILLTVLFLLVFVMMFAVFFSMLVMFLAVFGDQFSCVRNLVDAVFGILTIFETEMMGVDDDFL